MMKLTIWFFILILNLIITLQEPAEQCKGYEMSCAEEFECCSGACVLPIKDTSEEEDKPEKQCGCSLEGVSCLKTDDCCDGGAVCRDKKCIIVKDTCGKHCTRGIDCFGSCPLCKHGKCSKSTAKCNQPCPTGSSFECMEGGVCQNKICKCGSKCKMSNVECNDKSECCKKACQRIGEIGGKRVCA